MGMDALDWMLGISTTFPGGGGSGDSEFDQPAMLSEVVQFQLFDGDSLLISLMNEGLNRTGVVVDNARLAFGSVQKYLGAVNAGDFGAAQARAAEGNAHLEVLENSFLDLASNIRELATALDVEGIVLPNVSLSEVIDFREDVIFAGSYPAFELVLAQQMHITETEMSGMFATFVSRGLDGVTEEDVSDDLLIGTAILFEETNFRQNLPGIFNVPEPTSACLAWFVVCCLALRRQNSST